MFVIALSGVSVIAKEGVRNSSGVFVIAKEGVRNSSGVFVIAREDVRNSIAIQLRVTQLAIPQKSPKIRAVEHVKITR